MGDPLTCWRRPNQEESIVHSYLAAALEKSGLCIVVQDCDLRYLEILNIHERWKIDSDREPDDVSLFGQEFAGQLDTLKKGVMQTGRSERLELACDDETVFDFEIQNLANGEDASYLLTIIRDISFKKSTERVTLSLLREVSHRSKNLLAIIQSIATQTARHSDTLDTYLRRFRGRLYSLARAQDLITDSDWKGAMLEDLIRKQASSYFSDESGIIQFSGENILLPPNASLYLGLALHELIVQAATRRFLTNGSQSIRVELSRTNNGPQKDARLVWTEQYSSLNRGEELRDEPLELMEFERMLLEKIVPASLNGSAIYVAGDDALRYEISFPVVSRK